MLYCVSLLTIKLTQYYYLNFEKANSLFMDTSFSEGELKRAKAVVYRLLKIRLRSTKEIEEKLRRKEFSKKTIENIIGYFTKLKFLDDELFAKAWINSRLNKPFGVKRIRFELKIKGITNDILNAKLAEALENLDKGDLVDKLVGKMKMRYRHVVKLKAQQRAYGYLSRRGFDNDIVMKVIKQL